MTLTGKISRLATSKTYGFIVTGSSQYFFHRSAVEGAAFEDLREGQVVTFNEGTSAPGKGPRATHVRAVDVAGQPDAA